MTPSDQSIMHLITFYDIALFSAIGAYHELGAIRFIMTFKHVLKERKIGYHAVINGWIMLEMNDDCKRFAGMLNSELAKDGDMDVISYYTDLREKLREA